MSDRSDPSGSNQHPPTSEATAEPAVPPDPLPLAGAGGPVGGPVAGEILDAINQPLPAPDGTADE